MYRLRRLGATYLYIVSASGGECAEVRLFCSALMASAHRRGRDDGAILGGAHICTSVIGPSHVRPSLQVVANPRDWRRPLHRLLVTRRVGDDGGGAVVQL